LTEEIASILAEEKIVTSKCLEEILLKLSVVVHRLITKEEKGLKLDREMYHTPPSTAEETRFLEKSIEARKKRLVFLYKLLHSLDEFKLALKYEEVPMW